ncbi:hypothetical protein D3C77_707640 [compost metagenome]
MLSVQETAPYLLLQRHIDRTPMPIRTFYGVIQYLHFQVYDSFVLQMTSSSLLIPDRTRSVEPTIASE